MAKTRETAGIWPDFVAPQRFSDATPGWEDPALPDFRLIWAAAREVGYSVGLHGSMKRDCDLIAAPWTDEAVGSADLVDHLCKALNARIVGGPEQKPLGRVAVSLQIDGWFKVIDLSVAPRAEHSKPHDWFEFNGMTCCRSCGYVRNATSDTRACKGPVRVDLRSPAPLPREKQMARRVETRKLTNAEFAQRCAYLAKVTAAWAGDMLTLPEEHHTPVRVETVAMFTAEIRGWLDRLEQQVSPAPAHKEQAE